MIFHRGRVDRHLLRTRACFEGFVSTNSTRKTRRKSSRPSHPRRMQTPETSNGSRSRTSRDSRDGRTRPASSVEPRRPSRRGRGMRGVGSAAAGGRNDGGSREDGRKMGRRSGIGEAEKTAEQNWNRRAGRAQYWTKGGTRFFSRTRTVDDDSESRSFVHATFVMHRAMVSSVAVFAFLATVTVVCGQRITTIQLDGVQYFVSRMNPYSPELNYFLSYQYCRSLGLQLVSFETKEKADSITQYLKNAGYNKFDFWTSGNKLGTHMLLWMSTGLPFNVTFNYVRAAGSLPDEDVRAESTIPMMAPEATGRRADGNDVGAADGCVTLKAPDHRWEIDDCLEAKDFICEQTRCYYYNYGSIPVSASQGGNKILNPNASTEKPHRHDEGHLLNFTATRRITLRPPLVRREDDSAETEPTTENGLEDERADERSTAPSDPEETYHDAVLGKVSRSKAIRVPTVDRLERKISHDRMYRIHEKH